jgi:predicted RNA-binding protein with RPS1 domain
MTIGNNAATVDTAAIELTTNVAASANSGDLVNTTFCDEHIPDFSRPNGMPAVGNIVNGTVLKVLQDAKPGAVPHAMLIRFGTATGMLRTRDLVGSESEQSARVQTIKKSDEVVVMVSGRKVDGVQTRFDLSERLAVACIHAHQLVGKEVQGTVVSVTKFGAFIDIGTCATGLLHQKEMASGNQLNRLAGLKEGSAVSVVVLSVEPNAVNPSKLLIELSEVEAELRKMSNLTDTTHTARIVRPCESGTLLVFKNGVEAILPTENLGGTNAANFQKGQNLQVKIVGISGRALVTTREGVGGAHARAQQEAKRAVRRQNDQQTRQKMQGSGSSSSSGGNKGKK